MLYALLAGWFAKKDKGIQLCVTLHSCGSVLCALTPAILIDMLLGIWVYHSHLPACCLFVLEVMYLRFEAIQQSVSQLPTDKHDDEGSIIA